MKIIRNPLDALKNSDGHVQFCRVERGSGTPISARTKYHHLAICEQMIKDLNKHKGIEEPDF